MTVDLVTPEQLTPAFLAALYASAHIQHETDADGQVIITEGVPVFAVARPSGSLNLVTLVPANPERTAEERLAYANAINRSGAALRASVHDDGNFSLDWEVHVAGGVTEGHLVRETQAFLGNVFVVLSSESAKPMIVWE